jgi:glutamyl/glutaminyl-tRNA synthetase
MVNFLALMGWSPGTDEEVFTREELISRFSLEGISGGNAVFNPEKLDWFNQQHINRMSASEILMSIASDLERDGLKVGGMGSEERRRLERAVDLVKPRARKLGDFVMMLRPFGGRRIEPDPAAVAKFLSDAALRPHLQAWRQRLEQTDPFLASSIEQALRALAAERGVKAGVLIHATRVAVTGQSVSPGIFDVLEVMGRERVLDRLQDAANSLGA